MSHITSRSTVCPVCGRAQGIRVQGQVGHTSALARDHRLDEPCERLRLEVGAVGRGRRRQLQLHHALLGKLRIPPPPHLEQVGVEARGRRGMFGSGEAHVAVGAIREPIRVKVERPSEERALTTVAVVATMALLEPEPHALLTTTFCVGYACCDHFPVTRTSGVGWQVRRAARDRERESHDRQMTTH
jgi:hypothetical protein